jgi:hypothetical protein
MSTRPTVLLINPPLWNVYAPHLAVPLLVGALRERGWPARGLDLSIEHLDWLLSGPGLTALAPRLERRLDHDPDDRARVERALLVLPSAIEGIDRARTDLADLAVLHDHDRFRATSQTVRNALWCASAAFPNFECDLMANDL